VQKEAREEGMDHKGKRKKLNSAIKVPSLGFQTEEKENEREKRDLFLTGEANYINLTTLY